MLSHPGVLTPSDISRLHGQSVKDVKQLSDSREASMFDLKHWIPLQHVDGRSSALSIGPLEVAVSDLQRCAAAGS